MCCTTNRPGQVQYSGGRGSSESTTLTLSRPRRNANPVIKLRYRPRRNYYNKQNECNKFIASTILPGGSTAQTHPHSSTWRCMRYVECSVCSVRSRKSSSSLAPVVPESVHDDNMQSGSCGGSLHLRTGRISLQERRRRKGH